jgi:hypothetical protein
MSSPAETIEARRDEMPAADQNPANEMSRVLRTAPSTIPGASATSVPASSFSFVVSVAEVTLPQQYPTHEEEVSEP